MNGQATSANMADFNSAISYLSRDPGMKQVIDALRASKDPLLIQFTKGEYDEWTPSDNTIYWNPNNANCIVDDRGVPTGESQSPAMGLGHEMDHAAGSAMKYILARIYSSQYSNYEEKRVITGLETSAANTLGEGTRKNHRGNSKYVRSPTSRDCDCKK